MCSRLPAAYNTACLDAALADSAWRGCAPENILRELERRVIVSLRCVVDNPRSELERAWDWIFCDPHFRVMRNNRKQFTAFGEFLDELERQEYPAAMAGKCPVPHKHPAGNFAFAQDNWRARNPGLLPGAEPQPRGRWRARLRSVRYDPSAVIRSLPCGVCLIGQLAPEADGHLQ